MGKYDGPKSIVIVDIDGTLADITHRLPFIRREMRTNEFAALHGLSIMDKRKDWASFNHPLNIIQDKLLRPVYTLVQLLYHSGREIHLTSGRMAAPGVREATRDWLGSHGVFYHHLHMREDQDFRADDIVKREIHDREFKGREILLALDDRDRVVKMWRSLGIQTLQVAEGNF